MDANKSLEEQYREQIAAVLDEKKQVEQKLLEKIEETKELEKSLKNHREANHKLLLRYRALINNSIGVFWSERKRHVREDEELLNRGVEYWAPVFDAEYYAKVNSDIKDMFGEDEQQLLKHYIQVGVYEGRVGNKEFDVSKYVELNYDVADAFKGDYRAACMHYIEKGRFENRKK